MFADAELLREIAQATRHRAAAARARARGQFRIGHELDATAFQTEADAYDAAAERANIEPDVIALGHPRKDLQGG